MIGDSFDHLQSVIKETNQENLLPQLNHTTGKPLKTKQNARHGITRALDAILIYAVGSL